MYVIKVNIHDGNPEYLIFDNVNNIKEFIKDNIICNNVDYSNFYDNTQYSLDNYIYILRKPYNADDVHDIYNIVISDEFWDEHKIKNFENINKNSKYFKKISFCYDYKIIIDLDFSESDESVKSEDKNENKDNDKNEDFLEIEHDDNEDFSENKDEHDESEDLLEDVIKIDF
jgi:hypothetical protein